MYAQPILETSSRSKPDLRKIAKAEGWNTREINWERHMEAASELHAAGANRSKIAFHILAARVASLGFSNQDLRKLASKANMAWLYHSLGWHARSRKEYRKVAVAWSKFSDFENVEIKPRARSSLFHLRMEAKHWETYRQQRIVRMSRFAEETEQALVAFAQGKAAQSSFYSRWRGEKIPIFDDSRRILSACLLIIPPQNREPKNERT